MLASDRIMRRTHALVLALLAALAIVAYLPIFFQPLMQDDYPHVELARAYCSPSGWTTLMAEGGFRSRTTFLVLTRLLDSVFGPSSVAFYAAALLLHILCTWLVYALGSWRVIGFRASLIAAGFFAIHEGHQEAVMWYSATNESLQFLFGAGALLCWIWFLQKRGRWKWYAAALGLFVLAVLSKESAVIFAVLLLIPVWFHVGIRRSLLAWLPFAVLAAADVALIFSAGSSFRFKDGSFSPSAPFWITLPQSYGRLLWIWGVLALLAIVLTRAKQYRQLLLAALVWIAVALFPYSFLTYMHRVPSRQTYLASLGLAWIVAAGFWALHSRVHLHRRPVIAIVVLAAVIGNIGYLWTKKRQQYLRRAAPTEALVALVQRTGGPIYMLCNNSPIDHAVYPAAARLRTGKMPLVWERPASLAGVVEFCWTEKY